MIDISQATLAWLFVYSVALGILLGMFYDAIRFCKMLLGVDYGKRKARRGRARKAFVFFITFIFDVIFWLIFAASSVLLTYNVSGGVFRGMVYFGMLSGGAAYYLTLGRLTLKIGDATARFIKRAVWRVIKLILVPVRAIFSLIIKLYHLTFGKVIGKIISERKRRKEALRAALSPPADLIEKTQKENETNVTKRRYEREGRISFGGCRNKR